MSLREVKSGDGEAARKRAAVELIAKHERSLRRTARRFSICADDADDAYQRALEILLVKAPTDDGRQLIRWMTTVVKHEALKVRQSRERTVSRPTREGGEAEPDWVALIPAEGDGPAGLVERRERVARSREALQALKPAELKALTLLAEGYSYAEIGELTGFSRTKVNRCLAEGRERFRAMISRSEDGSRCEEMGALLSAFCDGETNPKQTAELREHLRACVHCRAALRAYRAAPRAAAALAPLLPVAASRSLLERAHETLVGLYVRLPGQGGAADSSLSQVAATGGTRGAGVAALAKVLAICVGTAGGAAACMATGVVPAPLGLAPGDDDPAIERRADRVGASASVPAPVPEPIQNEPPEDDDKQEQPPEGASEPMTDPVATDAGAVSYAPPPAPAPSPAPEPLPADSGSSSGSSGNVAGEFGP
ncbi:MAG TPA: sigma-70 family RNA polymerase sigma factor [Solirubrobacterales bacterium]